MQEGFYQQKGSFQELEVWQLAIQTGLDLYAVAGRLPDSEKFGLRSQLTRAAVSISSNIAEGHGRRTNPEFIRFLRISLGSARECQSLLVFMERLSFIESVEAEMNQLESIARMIFALIRRLEPAALTANRKP